MKEKWIAFNANFMLTSREEEDVVADFWMSIFEEKLKEIEIEHQGCSECGGCYVIIDGETIYDEKTLIKKMLNR